MKLFILEALKFKFFAMGDEILFFCIVRARIFRSFIPGECWLVTFWGIFIFCVLAGCESFQYCKGYKHFPCPCVLLNLTCLKSFCKNECSPIFAYLLKVREEIFIHSVCIGFRQFLKSVKNRFLIIFLLQKSIYIFAEFVPYFKQDFFCFSSGHFWSI